MCMCIHPSMHLCLCVRVCVCEMCLHASVHNIMCSAQPEVAAVLDWYGPEADPAYWQWTLGSVRSTQYTCRRKKHPPNFGGNFRPSYTDHFSILINYYIFSVGSYCQDIDTFYLLSTPISLSCICNSCALV